MSLNVRTAILGAAISLPHSCLLPPQNESDAQGIQEEGEEEEEEEEEKALPISFLTPSSFFPPPPKLSVTASLSRSEKMFLKVKIFPLTRRPIPYNISPQNTYAFNAHFFLRFVFVHNRGDDSEHVCLSTNLNCT